HANYKLKIQKDGTTYGVILVDPGHPDASKVLISTSSGVKALKKLDETPPTLTTVTITSSNANTSIATAGDTVTISFTSSETLLVVPTVTIDGNAAGNVVNTGGNNYAATRIMQSGDTAGQIAFSISNIIDNAGNAGSTVIAITVGANVTFVLPTYTVSYNGNGASGGSVPVDGNAYVQGTTVTVLGSGSLVNAGYNLAGWNTQANGLGTSYAIGATFTMGASDRTLYAIWIPNYLTYSSSGTTITLTGYTAAQSGSFVIPAGVTNLGPNAFKSWDGMTSVTIPVSVKYISYIAFQLCGGLTSINIPSSVTYLGAEAFWGCYGLTNITVDGANPNYKSISGVVFSKDETLIHTVPPGKTGNYTIPSTVTTIGRNAFQHCKLLTGVTIPNSVTTIDWHAFRYCSGLTSVSIPASVSSIEEGAFLNCSSLTAINVDGANPYYKSISGIMFSKDGTVLVEAPEALTGSYNVPAGVTTIFYSALMYSNFTSITLPAGVVDIQPYAFAFADISTFTMPTSVTTIGTYALEGINDLTSITIPANVTSMGRLVFAGCSNLSSVTVLATTPPVATGMGSYTWGAFDYCASTLQIHVPAGTVAAYQAAPGWSEYAGIIVYP
ncbi:MAG: leucine-rich repeat protein, partial [Spirochaetales bacterium]|nr:leucine-rich repeat protein [Spirochaetales bacterium]